MIKISAIIPIDNNLVNLEKTLASLKDQTITDIEIICLIDSIQASEIIDYYLSEKNVHKTYQSINIGKTLNNCLEKASGEYIIFLNNNIEFTNEESLQLLYTYAHNNNSDILCTTDTIQNNSPEEYFSVKAQEYDINVPIYNHLYKKEFLEENNIKFPDTKAYPYLLFKINTLLNVNKVNLLNMNWYKHIHDPYARKYVKISTFNKKIEHIQNFIKSCNLLIENGFNWQMRAVKKDFINYLLFRENLNDAQLNRIFSKYHEITDFFDENEYGYFFIDYILNPSKENNDYKLIKECLFEENMLEDEVIDVYRLQKFVHLRNMADKNDLAKESYKQARIVEKYTNLDKKEFEAHRNKIKNELIHNVNIKNSILSSNSWKFTESLRVLKRKIR